jgi:hypothetical protein
VAIALAGMPAALEALDLAGAKPPLEITDHHATIGGRTLVLPEGGRWFYVGHSTQDLRGGTRETVLTSRVKADLVQVDGGTVVLGLRLQLQKDDLFQVRWGREGCREADDFSASERAASPQSDCLRATKSDAEFDQAFGGARRWPALAQVRAPQAGVAIVYARQAAGTFGQLDVVVPAGRFESDAAAIAWAETLRTGLQPMFEHRQDTASLPPLPPPRSVPTAAAGVLPSTPPPAPSAPRQWGDR